MSRGSRDHVQQTSDGHHTHLSDRSAHLDAQWSPARHSRQAHRPRRSTALAVVLLTLSGLLVGTIAAPAAMAYPGPVTVRPSSVVTADALPTVQINGVVWSQAIAGDTVFAGGQFTNARPAGAAAGTNTTPRANILAYNITTGALITSINPSTNGTVYAVAASPDGSRIYIGGDFTQVNGVTKNRIAAISATTGQLITSFTASAGSRVKAIAATSDRVYFGGQFTSAGGSGRNRVAAVQASNGALTSWNPNADYTVNALVVSPDGSRVIVGGAFQNIGGAANYGLAAISASSGTSQSFPVNQIVRNAGPNSAILGLTTDGTNIYGNGYTYGTGGNFEGTFSATPAGALNWVEDCHGDTYGNYSAGPVVYTVSHAHYCGNMGGYGQSEPSPWALNMRHSLAFTKNATGTATPDPHGYPDWSGRPTPSLINWFPDMTSGSFTGQGQAAWSITGNGQYVVLGGEFPTVNGTGQQGLVRFATGTSKNGPRVTGAKFVPTLNSFSAGTMHVGFQTNWDRDDMALTYRVVRDSTVTIYNQTVNSTFWNRPFINITDTVAAGSHRYRLYVTDPAGNQVAGDTVTGTVSGSGAAQSNYATTVRDQGAGIYWRLGESSGSTALDWAGSSPGVAGSGVTRGVAGAIVGDGNTAASFNGTSTAHFAGQTAASSPSVFSASIWFKASSTTRGKLVGYGDQQTTNSSVYDRHIYMDNNGRLNFGVAPRARITITSAGSYRDNQWHQAVGHAWPERDAAVRRRGAGRGAIRHRLRRGRLGLLAGRRRHPQLELGQRPQQRVLQRLAR